MVELAAHPPIRRHLVAEAVPEGPGLALGPGAVQLLGLVEAVLDAARELHGVEGIADAGAAGLAPRLGAGLPVDQGAVLPVPAEAPALRRRQVDPHGPGQPGHGAGVLEAVLEEDARAVREARPRAGDQAASPLVQAAIRLLVAERVVHVHVGLLGLLVARPELARRPEVAVRDLPVEEESIVDAIGAADSDAPVVLPVPRLEQRGLSEAVAPPAGARLVAHLHHRVRAFALLLGHGHDRGVVLATLVSDPGAEAPAIGQPVADVDLLGGRLEPLVLDAMVRLTGALHPPRQRHAEGAAEEPRVGERGLARRRVAGLRTLSVEAQAPPRAVDPVPEADAEVGPVGIGFRVVGPRGRGRSAEEAEAAVGGAERRGH